MKSYRLVAYAYNIQANCSRCYDLDSDSDTVLESNKYYSGYGSSFDMSEFEILDSKVDYPNLCDSCVIELLVNRQIRRCSYPSDKFYVCEGCTKAYACPELVRDHSHLKLVPLMVKVALPLKITAKISRSAELAVYSSPADNLRKLKSSNLHGLSGKVLIPGSELK